MFQKRLYFVSIVVILFCSVSVSTITASELIVKLDVKPPNTEISTETPPVAITAKVQGTELKFDWQLAGVGSFQGNTNGYAVVYVPPTTIDGTSAVAIVSVKVSDYRGQEATESVVFTITQIDAPNEPSPTPYKLSITADLGTMLVRSGTLVPDGISPSGYDASGTTILSKPNQIHVSGKDDFRYPDGRSSSYKRAFLTFSLSSLPPDGRVKDATLVVPVTGLSGYDVYDNIILVESVNIGQELDVSDYATGGILLGKYTVDQIRQSPGIDITQGINVALQQNMKTITFRIRFEHEHTEEYFNNTEGGTVTVLYE